MAGRCLVFTPLTLKARQAFVNVWRLTALQVLAELDQHIRARPEAGTETSKRGCFVSKKAITISSKTFSCEVVYSFTDKAIRWESFDWKIVQAS